MKLRRLLPAIAAVTAAVLLLVYAKAVSAGIVASLSTCLSILIPSLFCFMVLGELLIRGGWLNPLLIPFRWIARYLLRVPADCLPIFVLSLIGGYPVGAKLIRTQLDAGALDQADAQRLLLCCINAGPAFLVGAVAVPVWDNPVLGGILLAANLLASLAVGFLFSRRSPVPQKRFLEKPVSISLPGIFVGAVRAAIQTMALICGTVLVFSCLLTLLRETGLLPLLQQELSRVLPPTLAELALHGFWDVTYVCRFPVAHFGLQSVLLVTGLTAFGGLCVHTQIFAILGGLKLNLRRFFGARLLYTGFNLLFVYGLLRFTHLDQAVFARTTPPVSQTFSVSPVSSVFLIFLCVMLLLSSKKYDKM